MLQSSPLIGDVQQIGIGGERRVIPLSLGHLNALALSIGDKLAAAGKVPLPPGRDDLDVWLQAIVPAGIAQLSLSLLHCNRPRLLLDSPVCSSMARVGTEFNACI